MTLQNALRRIASVSFCTLLFFDRAAAQKKVPRPAPLSVPITLARFKAHEEEQYTDVISGVAILPNGRLLTTGPAGEVATWTAQGVEIGRSKLPSEAIRTQCGGLAFLGNNRFALVSLNDAQIFSLNPLKPTLPLPKGWLSVIAYAPKTERLAYSVLNGVALVDSGMGKSVAMSPVSRKDADGRLVDQPGGVAFSPDGATLFVTTETRLITIDAQSGAMIQERNLPDRVGFRRVQVSPDGKLLAMSGSKCLRVFSLPDLAVKTEFPLPEADVNAVALAFSPNGDFLAVGTRKLDRYSGRFVVYDTTVWKPLHIQKEPVRAISWSANSTLILVGTERGEGILWQIPRQWRKVEKPLGE